MSVIGYSSFYSRHWIKKNKNVFGPAQDGVVDFETRDGRSWHTATRVLSIRNLPRQNNAEQCYFAFDRCRRTKNSVRLLYYIIKISQLCNLCILLMYIIYITIAYKKLIRVRKRSNKNNWFWRKLISKVHFLSYKV